MGMFSPLFSLASLGLQTINTGLHAVNTYQQYQIKNDIRSLTLGTQLGDRQVEVINELRNILFTGAQVLRKVGSTKNDFPLQASIAATLVKWRINDDLRLTPKVFDDYSDKEKLVELNENVQEILTSTDPLLTDDQKNTLSVCRDTISELPYFTQAITWLQAKSEYTEVERNWKKVSSRNTTGKIIGIILILVGIQFVSVTIFNSSTIAAISFIVAIAGLIVFFTAKTPEFDKIKNQKEMLEKLIPPVEVQEQLKNKFGETGLADLQKMKAAKEELLSNAIGDRNRFEQLLA
jgi:hypothetical protein